MNFWRHVTFAFHQETWKAQFQWPKEIIKAPCAALTPPWLKWIQKLFVESEALIMTLGLLEGSWPKTLSIEIGGWEKCWGISSSSASQTPWDAEASGYLLFQLARMDTIHFHILLQKTSSWPTVLPPEIWHFPSQNHASSSLLHASRTKVGSSFCSITLGQV